MASPGAIAKRRAEALARLEAAVARLAGEYGAELPPPVRAVAQQDLRQVMEVERICALIEGILGAADERVAAGTGGVDPAALDGTVAEVREYLASITDVGALGMLAATEGARERPRAGVLSAINKREAELEAEAESEEK